jgi:DNA polymerase I-like protein with 3'-5' exonuclease and polymerase domains
MPLVGLLAQMEQRGMALVPETIQQVKCDLATAINAVTAEIHAFTGSVFNVASNDDVGRVLFTTLALPVQGTTATHKPQVHTSPLAPEAPAAPSYAV